MFQLHLLVLHCSAVAFSVFDTHLLEGIVVAAVVVQFLVEVVDYLVAGHIQELSGMGDDDDCTLAVADVVLKPHDSIQVQVICWLVQ